MYGVVVITGTGSCMRRSMVESTVHGLHHVRVRGAAVLPASMKFVPAILVAPDL